MSWATDAAFDATGSATVAAASNATVSWVHGIPRPERNLLLAVLTDAIERFGRMATTRNPARRRDLGESERWILSDDRRWPYSFVNVCEALGIEPRPLRRALVEGRITDVPVADDHPLRRRPRRRTISR